MASVAPILTASAPVSTFLNNLVESFRRRIWSGDLPGLQSRRFGPSRVEWWVRLPHASANSAATTSTNAAKREVDRAASLFSPVPKLVGETLCAASLSAI